MALESHIADEHYRPCGGPSCCLTSHISMHLKLSGPTLIPNRILPALRTLTTLALVQFAGLPSHVTSPLAHCPLVAPMAYWGRYREARHPPSGSSSLPRAS